MPVSEGARGIDCGGVPSRKLSICYDLDLHVLTRSLRSWTE